MLLQYANIADADVFEIRPPCRGYWDGELENGNVLQYPGTLGYANFPSITMAVFMYRSTGFLLFRVVHILL
eukprot:2868440-Rhodomonas_salina.1